jgi:hypothetical protein
MAHPGLAAVCALGMPLVFLHSFAELTELPFATVVAFAFLAYQLRRFGAMALLISLAPLGRPEGFGLLLLAAMALLLHRRWYLLPLLLAPLIAWDIAGWLVFNREGHWWLWLPRHWPYSENSTYAAGSILHFVALMPMLIGPLLFPAVWIGLALNLREGIRFLLPWCSGGGPRCGSSSGGGVSVVRPPLQPSPGVPGEGEEVAAPDAAGDRAKAQPSAHIARCRILTAFLPLGVLGVHSLLFAMGKMASSGELRYLLVMAPLWAVSTAWGWQWLIDWLDSPSARRAMLQWAALAAVAPGCVNYFYRVLPLELPTRWLEAQRAVAWYEHSPLKIAYPRVMVAHPAVFYFLDISPTDPNRVEQWTANNATHPPAGTIAFWDPESSMGNADRARIISLSTLMQGGWVNDVRSEWKSNVNNPPPWANYKVTNPPKAPMDSLLPDTSMLWHIFESPETAVGSRTPSVAQAHDGTTWEARPMNR